MKKAAYFVAAAAILIATPAASAQRIIDNALPVNDITINRMDSQFALHFNLESQRLRPSANREFLITPVLVADNGADSAVFTSVLISGRNLFIRHRRNNDLDSVLMYQSGKHAEIAYTASVPLQKWMDNATLHIRSQRRGCCDRVAADYNDPIAHIRRPEFTPAYNYAFISGEDGSETFNAADTVKIRDLRGQAFINFPVNRTELRTDYMTNTTELAKITGTIDSVKGDPDITITSISITGYASPEGPYNNNVRLAKGRTQTLREHVEKLYRFPKNFIDTAYVHEDWAGLRAYVAGSQLADRDALLRVIDSNLEPDAKDAALKQQFPEVYTQLLASVYPHLRHSDYVITYRVRAYTRIDEIMEVLEKAPQKLSLYEFFHAQQAIEPGTDQYDELFETAVRMFPDDEVCNLNAANTAMKRGLYQQAQRYLDKAGNGNDAVYARGILAALTKDYPRALQLLGQAAQAGVPNADEALRQVTEVSKFADGHVEIIKD